MKETISIVQIVVTVLLTMAILVQVKGVGFGRVWGGWTTSFSRRGLEGLIFKGTFLLAFLFVGLAIFSLLV